MHGTASGNNKSMKQILLSTIAIFIYISSFSQSSNSNSSSWNNSFLNEKQSSPELNIYPNPCKRDKVTIDFKSHQISEIQITNITGKQVFSKRFKFTENKIQLQLNNIPNGIYLLKVKSGNNKTVVKKFIVYEE